MVARGDDTGHGCRLRLAWLQVLFRPVVRRSVAQVRGAVRSYGHHRRYARRFTRSAQLQRGAGHGRAAARRGAVGLPQLSALCVLGLGAPALAQAGAWHPPSAPESGLRDQTQEVVLLAPALDPYPRGELTRAFASLGIRAQSIGEARLDPALEACGTFSCLSQVARKSRGRAALARISSAGDGTQSLLLVLVDEDGQHAQSRVRVDAGLGAALAAAWRDASLAIALGNDAMIQLATRPSGARVWLDGAEAGTTPFARRVSAGPHRLIVKLEGFVAQERVLETRPGQVEAVQLALKREPRFDVGDLRDAPASGPSAWNYVLGGTLLLVAAPALIASVNALVNDGQCLRAGAAPDMCERARFGSRSAYLFAAGVVAFGTGGALLFARPLGAGPSPRVAADGTRDAAGPAGW